jgi:hypothetical protein
VEKSCLASVLQPSVETAQAEAAKVSLPTGRMLQSGLFGSDVHAARVGFTLPRPPLGMRVDDPFADQKAL